jgi:hypothetical protein
MNHTKNVRNLQQKTVCAERNPIILTAFGQRSAAGCDPLRHDGDHRFSGNKRPIHFAASELDRSWAPLVELIENRWRGRDGVRPLCAREVSMKVRDAQIEFPLRSSCGVFASQSHSSAWVFYSGASLGDGAHNLINERLGRRNNLENDQKLMISPSLWLSWWYFWIF